MSKKQRTKETKSKRQMRKDERQRKERQQRLITILIIVGVGLLLVFLIYTSSIQEDFVRITPVPRPMADGTINGDPQAKAVIQVFEDFKCKACKIYSQEVEPRVIAEIVEKGKAYYVFHQYPFLDDASDAKDSDNAALASECAAEQNRFWDYKDMLFANLNFLPGEFNENRLVDFTRALKLDRSAFEACYSEQRYLDKINADLTLGEQMGVGGTPSVFVNGQDVSPGKVPTFDEINAMVNAAQ